MMRITLKKQALKLATFTAFLGLVPQLAMALYVPDDLKPWVDWVLHKHETAACTMVERTKQTECVTYGDTSINIVTTQGATFQTTVKVEADNRQVTLPGQTWAWPENIMVNEKPMGANAFRDNPAVRLNKGTYTITGSIKWQNTPAYLTLPSGLAQLKVRINGKGEDMPQMRGNRLILQKAATPIKDDPRPIAENTSKVQVFRLVTDANPATITTNMRLTVTGVEREITIPDFHIALTEPVSYSGRLPVKRQKDGSYTVQVGAGVHTLTFIDRYAAGRLKELTMPNLPWAEEVWAFNPIPELRLVDTKAETPLNPDQTDMPNHWRNFAAYLMQSGDIMNFDIAREGAPTPPNNVLNLTRTMWLNQAGNQFTVRDNINGTMNQTWRLDMGGKGTLGRVNLNGQAQPLTQGAGTENATRTGVEVRDQNLNLEAHSILPVNLKPVNVLELPVGAWNSTFEHASTQLVLPSAWRPIAVTGAPKTRGTWFSQWNLYQFFFLLLTTALAFRFWNSAKWAAITFVALALSMHDHSSLLSQILIVLVFGMIMAALPAEAKLYKSVSRMRGLVLAFLVLFAVPFTLLHLQNAVYPHLSKQALFSFPAMDLGRHQDRVRGVVAKSAPETIAMQAEDMAVKRSRKEMRLEAAPAPIAADGLVASRGFGGAGGMQTFAARNEMDMEETMQTASLTEFDPNTRVPTGPGLPEWQRKNNAVQVTWPEGVTEGQSFKLWFLSPLGFRLLEILKILFFGLLLAKLFNNKFNLTGLRSKLGATTAAVLLGFSLLGAAPAHAANFPSEAMLKDLEQRLLEPAPCAPDCAFAEKAFITVRDNNVGIIMTYTAEEEVLVPLPKLSPVAFPWNIVVNNSANAFAIARGNTAYVLLPKGRNQVAVQYNPGEYNNLTIDLQQQIADFDSNLNGWNLSGLNNEGRPNTRRLTLSRTPDRKIQAPKKDEKKNTYKPLEFAGYANVTRQINLGNTWEIITRVHLEHGNPFTLDLPLLEGEKVLDGKFTKEDGKVRLRVSHRAATLRSEIEPAEVLKLMAAANNDYREIWQLNASGKWHVEQTAGIAPIMHKQHGQWRPKWQPYGGDVVELSIKRPIGVEGQELTIHNARLETSLRGQIKTHTLKLNIETTRPQTHKVTLAEGTVLKELYVNGRALSQPKAEEGQKLEVGLPLNHGMNNARLVWEENGADLSSIQTPEVNLNSAYVNFTQVVRGISDRWVVHSFGPDAGPYVKLWSVMLGMILLAWIMTKVMPQPLGFAGWMILALGFTQTDPAAFLFIAGWMLLLQWRASKGLKLTPFRFNMTQIGIVVLTLFVIGALFSTVKVGLLGTPEVYVEGHGSNVRMLQWYQDAGEGLLTSAGVYTLPVWVFRVIMMAWALWTAMWIMRTFKWAWQNFTTGGYWRRKEENQKA